MADNKATDFEREKWGVESAFRERELKVKEGELALKRAEEARSGWRSPLVVAILAAALAATGNILAAVVNGYLQRDLEDKTSEDFRILEMIKTQNPDQNTANLKWLLKANLISDPKRRTDLQALVDKTLRELGRPLLGQPAQMMPSKACAPWTSRLRKFQTVRIQQSSCGETACIQTRSALSRTTIN